MKLLLQLELLINKLIKNVDGMIMYCNSTLDIDTTTDFIIEHHRQHQTIAFQDHLMSQMKKHHGNNLNMYNKITKCIKAHDVHNNV